MGKLGSSFTVKAISMVIILSVLGMKASATNYTVGGATGWSLNSNMKEWANTTVCYAGDNLVFIYPNMHDVLEVDQGAFSNCQISKPLSTHIDGQTVISLKEPGTRYFICGRHCQSGLKVRVDVLQNSSDSTNRRSPKTPSKQSPPPPKRPPPTPSNQNILPPPPNSRFAPSPPNSKSPPPPLFTRAPHPPSPDSENPRSASSSPAQSHITTFFSISTISIFFLVNA